VQLTSPPVQAAVVKFSVAMVTGEAMASGLPVICSTNTGASEIVTSGEHGFIIPIRDANALAEKIEWFYKNQKLCRLMGMQGREHVKQFTWDVYGEKIFTIFEAVVEEKLIQPTFITEFPVEITRGSTAKVISPFTRLAWGVTFNSTPVSTLSA